MQWNVCLLFYVVFPGRQILVLSESTALGKGLSSLICGGVAIILLFRHVFKGYRIFVLLQTPWKLLIKLFCISQFWFANSGITLLITSGMDETQVMVSLHSLKLLYFSLCIWMYRYNSFLGSECSCCWFLVASFLLTFNVVFQQYVNYTTVTTGCRNLYLPVICKFKLQIIGNISSWTRPCEFVRIYCDMLL